MDLVLRVAGDRVARLASARAFDLFSSAGWEAWGLDRRPLIRQSMPVLIDGDLRLEDEHGLRPTVAVNQWLRELPVSGAPAPNTWEVYARVVKGWLQFLADRGLVVFGPREQLRSGLALYAEHRLAGPMEARLAESTWNLHVGVAPSRKWCVGGWS